jgi:hypothetical protein
MVLIQSLNPDLLNQVELFIQTALIPTFEDIQAALETQENFILIVSTPTAGDDTVNAFLTQMHPSKPLIPSALTEPIALQGWIGPSLYIEVFRDTDSTKLAQTGSYCLSVEFILNTSEIFCISPLAAYTDTCLNDPDLQHHIFGEAAQHQPLQNIDRAAIFDYFAESFEAFKRKISEVEPKSDSVIDFAIPYAISLPEQAAPSSFITQQRVHQLTQQLSDPQFPSHSKLSPKLDSTTQIKPVKDRYGQIINLTLEYGSNVPDSDFTEQLTHLSYYQSLRQLAHLHRFVQIQMQDWHKQNGQPSSGAVAFSLSQNIIQLADHLRQRIETLNETQLNTVITLDLQTECAILSAEQQQQTTLLSHIVQNPLLGYLDPYLLEQDASLDLQALLSDPTQPIDLHTQYLKGKDNIPLLAHVESCRSDKYQAYQKRNPERSGPSCFIEYAITQKLHSNKPVSIGPASKAVYPRLELLWGHADEPSMPLTQIWRIYPMLRNDPVQWLIIAATTDTQRLKTIALENGQIAQEGSSEYLGRSLQLMAQNLDEYTQMLAGLVTEAVEQKRVKYLHFHQTQDLQTGEPRDIVKLQFQLDR